MGLRTENPLIKDTFSSVNNWQLWDMIIKPFKYFLVYATSQLCYLEGYFTLANVFQNQIFYNTGYNTGFFSFSNFYFKEKCTLL